MTRRKYGAKGKPSIPAAAIEWASRQDKLDAQKKANPQKKAVVKLLEKDKTFHNRRILSDGKGVGNIYPVRHENCDMLFIKFDDDEAAKNPRLADINNAGERYHTYYGAMEVVRKALGGCDEE